MAASPSTATSHATVGAAIDKAGAVELDARLEGRGVSPVAGYGEAVILKIQPGEAGGAQEFAAWDPATGAITSLWTGEPGLQDVVAADGEWVATVRTGLSLPFAQWRLILRNAATGETRELASDDPRVAGAPGAVPRLPSGFAPQPRIAAGKVAWAELFIGVDGRLGERLRLYDIVSGETSSVAELADSMSQDMWSPAVGWNMVAWVEQSAAATAPEVVVQDLAAGTNRRIGDFEAPVVSVALDGGGRWLAWEQQDGGRGALDLVTGECLSFAGGAGWGTYGAGRYSWWAPATGRGGRGGFYDFETGVVRFREDQAGVAMNIAGVFGRWFGWQERPLDGSRAGAFYFVPVGEP